MAKRRFRVYRWLFTVGLLGGAAAALWLATNWSWVEHPRVRAHIDVRQNGGAEEHFVIRLPRDRIVDGGREGGLPAAYPAGVSLPAAVQDAGHVEQFKLRDREGEVVGVAVRHALRDGDAEDAGWILFLPARGALLLQHAEGGGGLAGALSRAGLRPGNAWTGNLDIQRTAGPVDGGRGRVVGGTREFSRHGGSYAERWRLTGMDEQGVLRGTIELETLTVIGR